jgi:hypothetical protein
MNTSLYQIPTHVIDASQSIDMITQEITELIKGAL